VHYEKIKRFATSPTIGFSNYNGHLLLQVFLHIKCYLTSCINCNGHGHNVYDQKIHVNIWNSLTTKFSYHVELIEKIGSMPTLYLH